MMEGGASDCSPKCLHGSGVGYPELVVHVDDAREGQNQGFDLVADGPGVHGAAHRDTVALHGGL